VADWKTFTVTYDSSGDTMYIIGVTEAAARATEDEHGIVWRYDSRGEVIGATVVYFREIWEERPQGLAHELATRFHISAPHAIRVVEHALEEARRA
jgi:hypothetical protein